MRVDVKIEITGATKEQLQHVYSRLNGVSFDGVDCEWTQAVEGEVITIRIDGETLAHTDFLAFTELLNALDVKWEEFEIEYSEEA